VIDFTPRFYGSSRLGPLGIPSPEFSKILGTALGRHSSTAILSKILPRSVLIGSASGSGRWLLRLSAEVASFFSVVLCLLGLLSMRPLLLNRLELHS
jgi:hypothetical protein